MPLSREEFVKRYANASLTERATAQSHFIDLCDMLGQPHPVASDSVGERYTFEKRVTRTSGGQGFADVWMRDHFAWEYKAGGKYKDLKAAYRQLSDYYEDLGNPPLLVVCDFERFEVHTKWTSERTRIYAFTLADLERNLATATCPLPPLEVLRALFTDTDALRPRRTDARVTQDAAKTFARLAERLEIEKRADTDTPLHTKQEIAHFLMRLLFCLFADSIDLLPNHVFKRLLQSDDRFRPRIFLRKLTLLFEAMSQPDGIFGEHSIKYFNGGLFDSASIITLGVGDLGILYEASKNFDWSHVAPEIFGTLFERSLNAERRSLIGAHYTSEEDILLLIEPVVMRPLVERWHNVRGSILTLLGRSPVSVGDHVSPGVALSAPKPFSGGNASLLTSNPRAEALLATWFDELSAIRILDPACGSGNFLYVALRRLLDLWNEARKFAIEQNIQIFTTHAIERMISPQQLFGIEIEFYAHELASIVVWIGFLQWKREHGIIHNPEPILRKLPNIEHDDAIVRYDQDGKPYEPEWPKVDFIIGNPPFLGGSKLRQEIDHDWVNDLQTIFRGRIAANADLCSYWFEKSRTALQDNSGLRVGLLATQGIRGGVNRRVLEAIAQSGSIFFAWSDREWQLEGAAVHVSMVGFDNGDETDKCLDGVAVTTINADLTSTIDVTTARVLPQNKSLCFRADEKGGPFDIGPHDAQKLLHLPVNVNGRLNGDVIRRWVNASDITGRSRNMWIIDFFGLSEKEAQFYEAPFQTLRRRIDLELADAALPNAKRTAMARDKWWLHRRPGSEMRTAVSKLRRFILTTCVSKYRFFVWNNPMTLPDHALYAFSRDDDYFFGILHSIAHESWSLATGTQLREVESGFRYTPESTFLTFPFPWPPGTEPSEADSPIVRAIADAARTLVRLRDAWLNPPGASEEDLKSRTLTNLYNLRPAWLDNAHRDLDIAVFAAYGWSYPLETQEILGRLLALNHQRAVTVPAITKARNGVAGSKRKRKKHPSI